MPISRRRFGLVSSGAVAAAGLAWWIWPRQPVNVLLITLDTTRADRVGVYGSETTKTPRLDQLAQRGTVFERAYAAAPLTLPSHATMLTGLWPPEHGIPANGENGLDESIPTVAEIFANGGYDTAAFVAAFVLDARFGLNRGFKVYDDDLSSATLSGEELDRYRDGRHVVAAAETWLKRRRRTGSGQPFFCWMHLYDPHDPYVPHRDEFSDEYDTHLYDGEVAYVDLLVGRMLDQLKQTGETERTVVVVTADHGESLGEHGESTHGYMLHESTLHVPLLVFDPRRILSGGQRVSATVSLVSLFSTLLDSAGIAHPKTSGQSLWPAVQGESVAPQVCYSMTDEPYREALWSPLRSIVTERWRYVRTTRPELYDLTQDPHETVNLADQQPDMVLELEAELARLEALFRHRDGTAVQMTDHERRVLESLGYTAGRGQAPAESVSAAPLKDIKEMIVFRDRYDKASELIRKTQWEPAAEILEAIIRDVPDYYKAMLDLGLCRMFQKRDDDAIVWFSRVLEVHPSNDRAHDMLGFTYLRQQKLQLSMKHFLEVLKVRPDSEHAHLFLGEINLRQGRHILARRHYETVLQVNPGNAAARKALEALQSAPANL